MGVRAHIVASFADMDVWTTARLMAPMFSKQGEMRILGPDNAGSGRRRSVNCRVSLCVAVMSIWKVQNEVEERGRRNPWTRSPDRMPTRRKPCQVFNDLSQMSENSCTRNENRLVEEELLLESDSTSSIERFCWRLPPRSKVT